MPNFRQIAQFGEGPRVFYADHKQPLRHPGEEIMSGLLIPLYRTNWSAYCVLQSKGVRKERGRCSSG